MKLHQTLWSAFKSEARKFRLARKAVALVRMAISAVVAFIEQLPSMIRDLLPIRILNSPFLGRIGHLATEQDVFIKEQLLSAGRRRRGVIIVGSRAVANERLLKYWSRYIWVIRSPFWTWIVGRLDEYFDLQFDVGRYAVAINDTAPYVAVLRAWGSRPALLSLTKAHQREGRARLAEMGVPADAEFICVHCREGGYSSSDEWAHSFRSSNIDNYLLAVSELTKLGFWCVRMGDPSMRHVPQMERFIDYAHLDIRSDSMDVFLCASGKFFLGSASGLSWMASVFGRSCAMANQVPLSTVLSYGRDDVAIPKLIWSERDKRFLTFCEILSSDVGNFRLANLYEKHRISALDNAADDIRDLALEMFERSEGRAVYTPEDEELQQRVKAMMRPGHFGYGGINRIGRNFLRKYALLLGDQTD